MSFSVANIEGYLPASLKLEIPPFSKKTMEIFSDVQPGKDLHDLTDAFQKMNCTVNTLKNLQSQLQIAEKYEKLHKILSVIGIASSVTLLIAGISALTDPSSIVLLPRFATATGVAGLIGSLIGTTLAFTDVSRLNKQLANTNVEAINKFQKLLQKYLVLNEDRLRREIGEKITELRMKAKDIQDLEKALLELDAYK